MHLAGLCTPAAARQAATKRSLTISPLPLPLQSFRPSSARAATSSAAPTASLFFAPAAAANYRAGMLRDGNLTDAELSAIQVSHASLLDRVAAWRCW
jgi:hypothetical protein